MRKTLFLCWLVTLGLSAMAQIDATDQNWRLVFEDDFSTPGRYWNARYRDLPLNKWAAYSIGSGVTHGAHEHQVYQRSQCVFDMSDSTMNLVANYVGGPLTENLCELPGGSHFRNEDTTLFYLSGMLDSYDTYHQMDKFLYGYFEIKCKLPVHRGAFPAFWLWGNGIPSDRHYEEIDIFEYSWRITDSIENHSSSVDFGSSRYFSTGIHFNPNTTDYDWRDTFARVYHTIPIEEPDLSDWNVFGCEWSPGTVTWYFNGQIIKEYKVADNVPYLPMRLKTNYAMDDYAFQNPFDVHHNDVPIWQGTDSLKIDYIRVYQLLWDCDNNKYITAQDEFDTFDYSVKKNIIITPNSSGININDPIQVNLKATESIEINGEFVLPTNSSLVIYNCPTITIE